jgi:hypothetical protein
MDTNVTQNEFSLAIGHTSNNRKRAACKTTVVLL